MARATKEGFTVDRIMRFTRHANKFPPGTIKGFCWMQTMDGREIEAAILDWTDKHNTRRLSRFDLSTGQYEGDIP